MSIKISIGVAEGELDWEALEECRNAPRSIPPELEPDALAGWPRPERDDEAEAELPAWAW